MYELSRADRLIARVFVLPSENATNARVAAEIFPVDAREGAEPVWRFYELSAPEASLLLEGTVDAFLYLGCSVREIESSDATNAVQIAA